MTTYMQYMYNLHGIKRRKIITAKKVNIKFIRRAGFRTLHKDFKLVDLKHMPENY